MSNCLRLVAVLQPRRRPTAARLVKLVAAKKIDAEGKIDASGKAKTTLKLDHQSVNNAHEHAMNADKKRDPEMHQTRKGQQWYFGTKLHIGVDRGTCAMSRCDRLS